MKVRSNSASLGVPLTFLLLRTFNHLLDCEYFKIIFHGVIICSLQFLVRKNGTHHRLGVFLMICTPVIFLSSVEAYDMDQNLLLS